MQQQLRTLLALCLRDATALIRAINSLLPAQVRLEGCSFSGNTPTTLPTLLADNREDPVAKGSFYSDSSSDEVYSYEGSSADSKPPPCITSAPFPLSAATTSFLTSEEDWLVAVREVCGCLR